MVQSLSTQPVVRRLAAYAVPATLAIAIAAPLSPASLAAEARSSAGASTLAQTHEQPRTLTAETFANPPTSVRPMYRWWMPLAYTDDEVLREELRDIAASGGGGVEVVPFAVPGAGHQDNSFLAEYGWGTPRWAHKMEVITAEAADLGLVVDQNLGPHYPATVPSLNSFNQPEAEQQLIYGREFGQPGSTRTGPLPSPTTAPPSVTTQLCAPAAVGDTVLRLKSLGGLAVGDTITVGAGATMEKVTVSGLGDRTSACADLTTSGVGKPHLEAESVVDVARTTRIRTLVAQCATECGPQTAKPVALVPSSVREVTDEVVDGRLSHTFGNGNGNPWVLIDLQQTASGLIAQRGGYTATQPNYVPDHLSRGGVEIQADYWDEHILTDAVRANLDRIGHGAVFEDSLEMGTTQKWTWKLLETFQQRHGYDPALLLPALLGSGQQANEAPAFELPGIGPKVRADYRETLSDLYTDQYVAPMQEWASGHGLDFRVQPYGLPIAAGAASAAAGVTEGESLGMGNFLGTVGPEQGFRALASGAHVAGRNVVSSECCAAFLGNYRSSVAGPQLPGMYGEGGDGSQVGGKYSNGVLDSVYKGYAGGVNQVVWHGYPYRDAPAGVGTPGRDGSWPGYHPWDIFGVLNVNDEFGPRQPNWPDYRNVNDNLARTQLVLRQGRSSVDLGIYYDDIGNADHVVPGIAQHLLGNDSATSSAGYTYDYLAPAFLEKPHVTVADDGSYRAGAAKEKALVLNDQKSMSVASAKRLLKLARDGMRIFIIGSAPSATPGAAPDEDQLAGLVTDLLAQPSVHEVRTETQLPAALRAAGIRPHVTPETPTAALGLVRRQGSGISYDFIYNRSAKPVEQHLTLTGSGRPYRLNTWTGKIEPIAEYTSDGRSVTVPVRIAPYDNVVIALAGNGSALGPTPGVHAVGSTGELLATGGKALSLRASVNGDYVTTLSNGKRVVTEVDGLAQPHELTDWTLRPQTWTPGANQYTSVKTDQPEIPLTSGPNGLPSWRDITSPVDLSTASGVATYRTTLTLPESWRPEDGAHLDLGKVLDTASVAVNGTNVVVNQADRGRIDLGATLRPGANTITVRVATTMFNAVRASGDSNYQLPDWQRAGLIGPIRITPYRDVPIR
ncbi:glycosyl hydrolase [Nocardioides sp. NBC_00368]|uniref:glycosyl hydrolase n=1 Tax=Nocardioides sp. NBC_00368 TaxID=2976000 RepID=UPI002E1B5CB6